jgi:LysM repeat protein
MPAPELQNLPFPSGTFWPLHNSLVLRIAYAKLRPVFGIRLSLIAAALFVPAARSQVTPVDWANIQEDVRGLSQRVGELTLRVEVLEHDNAKLRAELKTQPVDEVTVAQLNTAVADLNTAIHSAVATSKTEILEQVGNQMEKLARQTNAALDSLAKVQGSQSAAAVAPPDAGYLKGQPTYTVQKGDSIDQIARKTGAKSQDIIAANKIADPSKIMVGQILVIPGGKQASSPQP